MIGIDKLSYFWKGLFFKTNLLSSTAHNLVERYTNRHCCWSCRPETVQIIRPFMLFFFSRKKWRALYASHHAESEQTQIAILYKISFFRKGYGKIDSMSIVRTLSQRLKHLWHGRKYSKKEGREVPLMKTVACMTGPLHLYPFALHNNYPRCLS